MRNSGIVQHADDQRQKVGEAQDVFGRSMPN
jgi:hypothetical protein